MTLICATTNESKLNDYRQILKRLTLETAEELKTEYFIRVNPELANFDATIEGSPIDLEDIEETGLSLFENARLKARAAYDQLCKVVYTPIFADDSGTWVTTIGGPGIFTGRYAEDHKNMKKVTEQLRLIKNSYSGNAQYTFPVITTSVICLITPDGTEHFFSGQLNGFVDGNVLYDDQRIDRIDDIKPAYTRITIPELIFDTVANTERFETKYGSISKTLSEYPDTVYYDLCPRRLALMNMLTYLYEEQRGIL